MLRNPRLWTHRPPPIEVVQMDDLVLWLTLGVVVGGRLGHVLFYTPEIVWKDPLEILMVWHGGMSFHGGAIGVLVAGYAYARKNKVDPLRLGDIVVAAEPIGGFLVRIANFINGELWGRPSDVWWAMVFPNGGPVPRHPSQLYEAALEGLVLFAVLAVLVWLGGLKRPGLVTGAFAVGYGVARVVCELFREPDAQLGFLWGGLTMGMLLCIPVILAGAALLGLALRREPAAKNG
jgi:phosphatidylglycerol:prolipoprotein diacylglycerol transferase